MTLPGQANAQNVGQIQLAIFANPAGLEALGGNLFKETGASGQATAGSPDANGIGAINQGFVEGSNVNVVEELVNMISRAAHLRNEFKGHHDRRQNARNDQPSR